MYGYIYKTTNLINGKIYIGQKKSPKFLGEKYLGSGKRLYYALDKYGKENFKVELIEKIYDEKLINEREIYWINHYQSTNRKIGYNISNGGNGGFVLKNDPEAQEKAKLKYRQTMIDKYNGSSIKGKKVINKDGGNKLVYPNEIEQYLSKGWQLGSCHHLQLSDETKQKLSDAHKGKPNKTINYRTIANEELNLQKKVSRCEVEHYISQGWHLGILNKNRPKFSDEQRKNMSNAHKGKPTNRVGVVRINNGVDTKFVPKEELEQYLLSGWVMGAINFSNEHRKHLSESLKNNPNVNFFEGYIYINNKTQEKRILPEELSEYEKNGWIKGRLPIKWVSITKDNKHKHVNEKNLYKYLNDGWELQNNKERESD